MLRINSHMKLTPSSAPPYAAPTPLTAAAFCAKRKRAPCKRPSSAHRPTGSEVVKESKAVARAPSGERNAVAAARRRSQQASDFFTASQERLQVLMPSNAYAGHMRN